MEATNKKLTENRVYNPKTLSAIARSLLLRHPWPGNVRELQNTLTRAALWSRESVIDKQAIEDAMLPITKVNQRSDDILGRDLRDGFDLEEVIGTVARHYLDRALKEYGGNKSKAAKALNFKSYQRLDVWLQKYNIAIIT
jgi:transcriptional regulator with PAS, ATPase and Fis domain